MIDRYFISEEFRYVITDNKEGAQKGVRWLVRDGVREIIYIGEKIRHQSIDDRLTGVKEETEIYVLLEKTLFSVSLKEKMLKKHVTLSLKRG